MVGRDCGNITCQTTWQKISDFLDDNVTKPLKSFLSQLWDNPIVQTIDWGFASMFRFFRDPIIGGFYRRKNKRHDRFYIKCGNYDDCQSPNN